MANIGSKAGHKPHKSDGLPTNGKPSVMGWDTVNRLLIIAYPSHSPTGGRSLGFISGSSANYLSVSQNPGSHRAQRCTFECSAFSSAWVNVSFITNYLVHPPWEKGLLGTGQMVPGQGTQRRARPFNPTGFSA